MAMQAPELTAEDFMRLPRFGVYANLQVGGNSTGWISGKTNPPPSVIREIAEARVISQERYGKDARGVEQEYLGFMGYGADRDTGKFGGENSTKGNGDAIGRKKKS
jgi:hypothetical protein